MFYRYRCTYKRLCCQIGKIAEKLYNHVIGHMWYVNILSWLRFPLSLIPKRDLDTKKTTPNIEDCPESLGAMLKYRYIEQVRPIDDNLLSLWKFTWEVQWPHVHIMVSMLHSGVSGPGSSPGWGHCFAILGKTLYCHSAFLLPGV